MQPADRLNAILRNALVAGAASLTHRERSVFYLNVFLIEFDSGGLTGFLYNACRSEPGPEWTAVGNTIAALNAVDATPTALALSRALEILRAVPATPDDETWVAFLVQIDPAGELDAIHSQIETVSETLWDRLYAEASSLPVE